MLDILRVIWDSEDSSWRGCTGHNAFQETVEDRSSLHFGDSFPPDWTDASAAVLLFCHVPSGDLPAVVIGKDLHRALPEGLCVDHLRALRRIEIVRHGATRELEVGVPLPDGLYGEREPAGAASSVACISSWDVVHSS